MRTLLVLLLPIGVSVGCSDDPVPEGPPVYNGGMLDIEGCDYHVTTRLDAEAPHEAKDVFGTDPTPRLVHLGFIGDPKTSMVAQWRTVDEVTRAGLVRYGVGAGLTADQLTETAAGIQFTFKVGGTDRPRMHQAHMCGLTPGTAYSYQVGTKDASGVDHFSPVYSFRTAPDIVAHPDAELVVGSLGDCRGGYDVWQQLATMVKALDPDLLLFSGDAVTFGQVQAEWDEFLTRAEPLLASVPMVFANGNHEANSINYYSQFALPGDQENFSIDYGFAHLTVLNDSPEDPATLSGATASFLHADLEANKTAQWKLAMHHQAIFSSAMHGSNATLQQAWQPFYDQYKVDLVLNGHDHDFEMSKPMVGQTPKATVDDGTVYVVQGGAGAELYDATAKPHTLMLEKTYSASVLHIRKTQLTFDAFRPDGSAIPATFSKSKP